MSTKLKTFVALFNSVLDRNQRYLWFTRGVEFQKQAICELQALSKKTKSMKKTTIIKKDEKAANMLLSMDSLVTATINELQMYVYLKEDNMGKAWESLVNAQSALRCACQADDTILKNIESYVQKLNLIEHAFFPQQMFNSIEAIIKKGLVLFAVVNMAMPPCKG